MQEFEILTFTEEKMQVSIKSFTDALAKIRTSRASSGLLESIRIEYHGSIFPVLQIANINTIDSNTLSIRPYEQSSSLTIEKAILQSNLGLTPKRSGSEIIISFPKLTEERRHDLVKIIKKKSEDAKVIIRNLRREANDHIKQLVKEKKISDDQERRLQNNVQKLTNQFIENIEKIIECKETEVMSF